MTANSTTTMCARRPPVSLPKRVWIHSAPVSTLERLSHIDRKTARKTWLNTGQSHGIQTLLRP